MKRCLAIVGLALCASSSGCGTFMTRFARDDGDVFGAYPFHAVALDGYFISRAFGGGEEMMGMAASGETLLLWGLVSLPFDLVVDVIAAPVDLVAWACGAEKLPRVSEPDHRDATGP